MILRKRSDFLTNRLKNIKIKLTSTLAGFLNQKEVLVSCSELDFAVALH